MPFSQRSKIVFVMSLEIITDIFKMIRGFFSFIVAETRLWRDLGLFVGDIKCFPPWLVVGFVGIADEPGKLIFQIAQLRSQVVDEIFLSGEICFLELWRA